MGDFLWSKIGAHFSEQTAQKSAKNERERSSKKRAHGRSLVLARLIVSVFLNIY